MYFYYKLSAQLLPKQLLSLIFYSTRKFSLRSAQFNNKHLPKEFVNPTNT